MPSPSWRVSSWWVARSKKKQHPDGFPFSGWVPTRMRNRRSPNPSPSYLGSHILIDSEHVLRQNAKHLFLSQRLFPVWIEWAMEGKKQEFSIYCLNYHLHLETACCLVGRNLQAAHTHTWDYTRRCLVRPVQIISSGIGLHLKNHEVRHVAW